MPQTQVFLSYASEDRRTITKLAAKIEAAGALRGWQLSLWWDQASLQVADRFDAEIRRAIERAHIGIVCVSQAYVRRIGYTRRELGLMVDRSRSDDEGRMALLPVKLENCALPPQLSHLHVIDAFTARGLGALVAAIGGHLVAEPSPLPLQLEVALDRLAAALQASDLRGADQITSQVCESLAGKAAERRLSTVVRATALQSIDQLWSGASGNRFGFARQACLWRPPIDGNEISGAFDGLASAVGWCVAGEWLMDYANMRFDFDAQPGHLPSLRLLEDENESYWWEAWRRRVVTVHVAFGRS